MTEITIESKKNKEIIDITKKVREQVSIQNGLLNIFVLHTTCSVCIAELDPGTDLDYLDAIEAIAPELSYRHAHNPAHAPDHIMSSIIGASLTVPIKNNELNLGTWQSIVLIELNGPRTRKIKISQVKAV
jgi:secondary thiamine-phosphate synthase enzyme